MCLVTTESMFCVILLLCLKCIYLLELFTVNETFTFTLIFVYV